MWTFNVTKSSSTTALSHLINHFMLQYRPHRINQRNGRCHSCYPNCTAATHPPCTPVTAVLAEQEWRCEYALKDWWARDVRTDRDVLKCSSRGSQQNAAGIFVHPFSVYSYDLSWPDHLTFLLCSATQARVSVTHRDSEEVIKQHLQFACDRLHYRW